MAHYTSFICWICFVVGSTALAQPNILFIESDDQSNQAVGAYGNKAMKTPNIDKLAKAGVAFSAAYNMGCWSPAVCIPSRTMLFYGKHLWEAQKITKANAPLSLPERLKSVGYTTYMTGKWHVWGKPPHTIFDSLGSVQPGQLKTYHTPQGHATDITGQEAAQFIANYQSDAPFFLYVAFNAPHVPRQTSQAYYDYYPAEQVKLPPSVVHGPLHPDVEYNYTKSPLNLSHMRQRVMQNNAMVTHMDDRIGDILAALKASGQYENTIIVFTSDHGINFGENGVAGKVCLYEPSVTAPLIISGPGIPEGKAFDERVYLQDVAPTLLSLVGASLPQKSVFQSLLPIIEKSKKPRKAIYLGMMDSQRAIIAKNQKLILYPKSGRLELYHLEHDPWETNNLSDKPFAKKQIKSLMKHMVAWQKTTGDSLSLSTLFSQYIQ